jgi:hypothetical protein
MRLFGSNYKITFISKNDEVDHDGRHDNLRGQIDYERRSIRILKSPGRHEDSILQTYFHELIHAIDNNGLRLNLSERIVDGIALGLFSWVKENNIQVRIK